MVALAVLALASCSFNNNGFLASAGPVAQAERDHFFSIIGWMLIVIVPLYVALPIVLWKYRLGKRSSAYRPQWTFSWLLEGLVWGIPLVIVAVLGWNLWRVSHKLDPYQPVAGDKPPLHIQVVSLDWKWLFIYPRQHIASVNRLELPVNRRVSFQLTSQTVMQSFLIPRLGSQIYTMPGMTTQLNLRPERRGTYRGENTQYNGEGFAEQKFKVRVVEAAEFNHWVGRQQSRPALDMARYRQLAKRSVLPQPITFGGVPDTLFNQIVSRTNAVSASKTNVAEPKSEHAQKQETKRLHHEERAYQNTREHGG